MIELHLPWPPSVNSYWRHITSGKLAGRVLISEKGRAYRTSVRVARLDQLRIGGPLPLAGRLSVSIDAYPPDRRWRDLDNLPKAVLDGLTHAGLWLDDSQIDRLLIERREPLVGGGLTVKISELEKS